MASREGRRRLLLYWSAFSFTLEDRELWGPTTLVLASLTATSFVLVT